MSGTRQFSKQSENRECIKDKTEINVMFCLIQNAENVNIDSQAVEVETNMNHVLYDIQHILQDVNKKGHPVHKAFVYGNRLQLYVKPFEEADVNTIFYADSTVFYADRKIFSSDYAVGNADGAHLLVMADAMLREQSGHVSSVDNILIILLERQLEQNEIDRFLCVQREENLPYRILLLEKKRYEDGLENYVSIHDGKIYVFKDKEDIVAYFMLEELRSTTTT